MKQAVMRQGKHFLLALSFLTRVPVRHLDVTALRLSHAVVFFPLIGLLLGGVGASLFWLLHLWLPVSVAVVLVLGALMLLTGALHEDGLADSFDAFGSKTKHDEIFTVLHDSRIGTYAAVALIIALLIKFTTLTEMPSMVIVQALVLGHMLSRWAMIPILFAFPYPQATATPAKRFVETVAAVPRSHLLVAAVYVAVCAYLLATFTGLLLMAVATVMGFAMARYFYRRIKGVSGDCYGAIQQCCEVLIYLIILWRV